MPACPAPEAAWYEATTISSRPNARCSAPAATISDSVVQFGLEMMPLGRRPTSAGLTSGTTSGTSGSMRKAPELSTATAPRAAATGAHWAETSSGTSNMATSMPSNASSESATTSVSPPRTVSRRPAERAEAISRISPQTSSRVDSRSSMTVPTAPVAPTTASEGREALIGRSPRRLRFPPGRSRAQSPCGWRSPQVDVVLVHHHRDPDLRGGDHLDVHARVGQRAEERGAHPRVGPHARPDQGDLTDAVVVEQGLEAHGLLDALQRGHRAVAVVPGQREGDVGAPGGHRGYVLHDHVDVDVGLGDGLEDPRRHADPVRHAHDRDLRLTPVVRHAGDDGLLHLACLRNLVRVPLDPAPGPVGEGRPHVDGHPVPA